MKEIRDQHIHIKVTKTQKQKLRDMAKRANLSLSSFVLYTLLLQEELKRFKSTISITRD